MAQVRPRQARMGMRVEGQTFWCRYGPNTQGEPACVVTLSDMTAVNALSTHTLQQHALRCSSSSNGKRRCKQVLYV